MSDRIPSQPDDTQGLLELARVARADVPLPADAHVLGEPVTVMEIRAAGRPAAGVLRATCRRGDHAYEVCLADLVFPTASAGAALVARYREWLGLPAFAASAVEAIRPHKATHDDLAVGEPVELVVLACKSNALRCRLLASGREVTLRTAVRDEIPGAIVTVTPRKRWTHGHHPYVSGEVAAVRIDATVLGLVPLALHREAAPPTASAGGDAPPVYRLAPAGPHGRDGADADLLREARACVAAAEYAEANVQLHAVLALEPRCLEAHAMLGEHNLRHWPVLASRHFELGVAIGSLTIGEDFDGLLPWCVVDNRPFLRCLDGLARALVRLDRGAAAAATLRRLVRLDPEDVLGARARLAAVDAVGRGLETDA